MRIRSALALVASATVIGGGVLLAPPASAASQSITVDCIAGTASYVTVERGDQLTFVLDSGC